MVVLRNFKKAQTVLYQGETPQYSFRIKKGLIRAYTIHENGDEATIAFFGPCDIFPIAAPFSITPIALFYYETVVDTVCECYTGSELIDELERDARHELKRFARRYAGALLHVASLAQNTARLKVAHTLRYLTLRFGEQLPDGQHTKINLRLTQHDLARLCNMSRETANLELGILRSEGVVMERAKKYVVHRQKLARITGDEATQAMQRMKTVS